MGIDEMWRLVAIAVVREVSAMPSAPDDATSCTADSAALAACHVRSMAVGGDSLVQVASQRRKPGALVAELHEGGEIGIGRPQELHVGRSLPPVVGAAVRAHWGDGIAANAKADLSTRWPAWMSVVEASGRRVASAAWARLAQSLARVAPYDGPVLVTIIFVLVVCLLGTSMLLVFASRVDLEASVPETVVVRAGETRNREPRNVPDVMAFDNKGGTGSQGSDSSHLCPGLVVPPGSECFLAVRATVTTTANQVEFDVVDLGGRAVFRVEVTRSFQTSRPWPAQMLVNPTVVLRTLPRPGGPESSVLAYCCSVAKDSPRGNDVPGGGSRRHVYMYGPDDELFAHLVKEDSKQSYVLTSGRLGLRLLFEGIFSQNVVNVYSDLKALLASTEPHEMVFDRDNQYYKLRVASGVDVGLVVCGLLAINQAEVT